MLAGRSLDLKFVVAFVAIPYLIGHYLSSQQPWTKIQTIPAPWLFTDKSTSSSTEGRNLVQVLSTEDQVEECLRNIRKVLDIESGIWEGVSLVVHRNGQAEPCGRTTAKEVFMEALKSALAEMGVCPDVTSKYSAESLMTLLIHAGLAESCVSEEKDRAPETGFYGFCDMGVAKTPILLDHQKLVPIETADKSGRDVTFLPCHFHDKHGVRITTFSQVAEAVKRQKAMNCESGESDCGLNDLDLYAVPAGRTFMFAPAYVGQIIDLPHVTGGDPSKPVYLEVLSLSPRVFELYNFFTREESEDLVDRALKETREDYRIKRSSTGASGYNINPHRTSESGYDTSGHTAVIIKRRCLNVLGYDEYFESHTDGLQMLRYNLTTAYRPHMDWIEGSKQLSHDYDSSKKGGNRHATILLYMTDMGEKDGGETVFVEAWPSDRPEEDRVDMTTAIQRLRESGDSSVLKQGSWEEDMAARCRTRLAIRPHAGRSILFYSQHPNGMEDRSSMHGACPVLSGQKYAANLWVWSTPRDGFQGNPRNPHYKDTDTEESSSEETKLVTFHNRGLEFEEAGLYYEDNFYSTLNANDPPVSYNTHEGHVWNVKSGGKVVRTYTIAEKKKYVFTI